MQDTCGTSAAQQAYAHATQQAHAHVRAVAAAVLHPPSPSRPPGHSHAHSALDSCAAGVPLGGAREQQQQEQDWGVWVGVEGRAQRALCLMGRLRSQLAALQSLDAARRK